MNVTESDGSDRQSMLYARKKQKLRKLLLDIANTIKKYYQRTLIVYEGTADYDRKTLFIAIGTTTFWNRKILDCCYERYYPDHEIIIARIMDEMPKELIKQELIKFSEENEIDELKIRREYA